MQRAKGANLQTPSRKRPALTLVEALGVEVYSILSRALTAAGCSTVRQKRLFARAARAQLPVEATSERVLQQFHDLSALLGAWLEDLPYIDATGRPKILPIRGKGATFESLARQYLPERSLDEAIAFACKSSPNVDKLPGNRIAFRGDRVVKHADNDIAALAQIVSHVTNIVKTVQLNKSKARRTANTGLLERVVRNELSPEQFEVFRELIRPQLDALTEQADRVMKALAEKSPRRSKRKYTAGVGVYLYLREHDSPRTPRPALRHGARTR